MQAPDFWAAGGGSAMSRSFSLALSPLGSLYGAITSARAAKPPLWNAPVPVICIGNAVVGGAGKTQVCLDLLRRLSTPERTAHVLSRGYGGQLSGPVRVDIDTHSAADVGDEAFILARAAPTWVSSDRTATARAAAEDGAGLLIMDDGFQNPALHKDINLLVIDGGYGFGNGRIFPAGPLRESAESAFARADAVCMIGAPGAAMPDIPKHLPVFQAQIIPAPDSTSVAGKKVIAFAGIGRPEKFYETLKGAGADILKTRNFPDHHRFTAHEIKALLQDAADQDAVLITTGKDHVRLDPALRDRVSPFPVILEWQDGPALERFILERIGIN